MSVIQSTQPELRYSKRSNLEHEARIVGNYYRDLIRSYGIDCIYHKLDTKEFENFKNIIDKNTILKHAYGYNFDPDYSMSAHMLTYMEVENDIFQLNKYGLNPNMDVNFYFENNDFACALATKLGQYKEYPIKEIEIHCEVPECNSDFIEYIDKNTGETKKDYLSSHVFPYNLGMGYNEYFYCENLSGKLNVEIDGYEVGKKTTIVCNPYEHTDFSVEFDSNTDLYKSMKHKIENDDYVETMLYLTYVVDKVTIGKNKYKYILNGKIHGNVLFYDIKSLGKYIEKIHPSVGDIVTIDFPDEKNREKYEITECFDKQLTQDGISPLLHKYIWKCKARRYVDSYNDTIEQSEADERLQEKKEYEQAVNEEIAKQISIYDDNQDAAYGGYEFDANTAKNYDRQDVRNIEHVKYEYISGSQLIDIMCFECGSKLCTDGYNLIFITENNDAYIVATSETTRVVNAAVFESNAKWLKATDSQVYFTNIEGITTVIAYDDTIEPIKEINLASTYGFTIDNDNINSKNESFVKFKGCRTYLFATSDKLFVTFESSKETYQLI